VILGEFRDGFPRVTLSLVGADGRPAAVEFIVDTAFDGDLKLPATLLRRLQTNELGTQTRMLVDGSLVECAHHEVTLLWESEPLLVRALVMPGNALLGTNPLLGAHLDIEMDEGGEVVIELPG